MRVVDSAAHHPVVVPSSSAVGVPPPPPPSPCRSSSCSNDDDYDETNALLRNDDFKNNTSSAEDDAAAAAGAARGPSSRRQSDLCWITSTQEEDDPPTPSSSGTILQPTSSSSQQQLLRLVHPSIASVLRLAGVDDNDNDQEQLGRQGSRTEEREHGDDRITNLIRSAARRCDDDAFGTVRREEEGPFDDNSNLRHHVLLLLHRILRHCKGSSCEAVAALLLATLWLEESIGDAVRQLASKSTTAPAISSSLAPSSTTTRPKQRSPQAKQAPLLSRMIAEYTDRLSCLEEEDEDNPDAVATDPTERLDMGHGSVNLPVKVLLPALLLPNDNGLNLRNLVWHGFLGSVDRAWLSLVLNLNRQVQNSSAIRKNGNDLDREMAPAPPAATAEASKPRASSPSSIASLSSSSIPDSSGTIPVERLLDRLPESWRIRATDLEGVNAARTQRRRQCQHDSTSTCLEIDDEDHHPQAREHPSGSCVRPSWEAIGTSIEAFMPTPEHAELWRLAKFWIEAAPRVRSSAEELVGPDPRPIGIICAVLVVLLEAGLRRMFCTANPQRRGRDDVARPGAYYVTLDGHGQRDRHELLLQPYLSEFDNAEDSKGDPGPCSTDSAAASSVKTVKNRLLETLGASRTSFLTDLFVSPHGPNLRAALSHGAWSARMKGDVRRWGALEGLAPVSTPPVATSGPTDEEALDSMEALLSALYCCATCDESVTGIDDEKQQKKDRASYYPQCSFTAVVLDALRGLRHTCDQIEVLLQSPEFIAVSGDPDLVAVREKWEAGVGFLFDGDEAATAGSVHFRQRLDEAIERFRPKDQAGSGTEEWTLACLLREYETNRWLGPMVAQRALLDDVLAFLTRLHSLLISTLQDLSDDAGIATQLSSRQRRSKLRLLGCVPYVHQFVLFACHVALTSLQPPEMEVDESSDGHGSSAKDFLQLVERTRMVVSTVSTFWTVNMDRALKSIEDYSRSKLVKHYAQRQVVDDDRRSLAS